MVGPSGCGKTLLVRMLVEKLGPEIGPFVHVVFPQMTAGELLAFLATELGTPASNAVPSVDDSVRRIGATLSENASQGRHAVVAVDEAHLLENARVFEALRLLLNFETQGRPDLTLLLIGQPVLAPVLERMPQLDERMGVKCLLPPLSFEETIGYVEHRMNSAGARRGIFTSSALEAVYHLSHGVPRRINRLCDLALLIGFANEQRSIDYSHVEAVADELVTVAAD